MVCYVLRHFPLGMRILKTGFAVFLCCLGGHLIGTSPFFAAIAAVITMKTTYEDSVAIGRSRVLGTMIGGIAGMGLLYVFAFFGLTPANLGYDVVSVLILMGLIKILAEVYQTGTIIITAVVFLSLLYLEFGEMTILAYSSLRVFETLAGVLIALAVNRVFPYREEVVLEIGDEG